MRVAACESAGTIRHFAAVSLAKPHGTNCDEFQQTSNLVVAGFLGKAFANAAESQFEP